MTRIKICGITSVEDAVAASDLGADFVGVVFAESPRRVDAERALAIVRAPGRRAQLVGVFMNQPAEDVRSTATECGLNIVQLHGDEPLEYCNRLELSIFKRIQTSPTDDAATLRARIMPFAVHDAVLLDPGAGSGRTFDWSVAVGVSDEFNLIVSGGLTPDNVGECVRLLRPYAVDVSSGVERSPGIKDAAKIRAFVQAVREADMTKRGA
jgi:phosphoribosylanthranilate isomerase